MKKLVVLSLFVVFFAFSQVSFGAGSSIWSVSDPSCLNPESVYYDQGSDILYVSNVSGAGDKKDGKGWISKLNSKGKIVSSKWVGGFNAPKGMRSQNGTLWVSDIDQLVSINMKSGKIVKRINIDGAKFLNDIAITPDGTVYVSDTIGGSIYSIKNGKVSTFVSGKHLKAPNGLLYKDGKLYVASWGAGLAKDWSTTSPGGIYYIDLKTKKIHNITKKPLGNLDGIEMDREGNFIVSDWVAGKVYSVDKNGKSKLLCSGKKGFADIGFIPNRELIVVPEMLESKITAYKR